jgi:hypothetical protein
MPYSDPEKKKEYNKAYYQRNKARINADRIITYVRKNQISEDEETDDHATIASLLP